VLIDEGNILYLQSVSGVHRHFTGHRASIHRRHLYHHRRRRRRRHLHRRLYLTIKTACTRGSWNICGTTSLVEQSCPQCPHQRCLARTGDGQASTAVAAAAAALSAVIHVLRNAGNVARLTVS